MGRIAREVHRHLHGPERPAAEDAVHLERCGSPGIGSPRRDDARPAADPFAALDVFEDRVGGVDRRGPDLVDADGAEVIPDALLERGLRPQRSAAREDARAVAREIRATRPARPARPAEPRYSR